MLQAISQTLGISVSRETLISRALSLPSTVGATRFEQTLENTEGYRTGKDLRSTRFWCSKMTSIMSELSDAHSPRAPVEIYRSDLPPREHLDDRVITHTLAGYQFACWLRCQGYAAMHVLPRLDPPLMETGGLKMDWLTKVVVSLCHGFIYLLPDSVPAYSAFSEANFKALEAGNQNSFAAGMEMLTALQNIKFDLRGLSKLVIVVDDLSMCECEKTAVKIEQLNAVLERICVRNEAHLVYTLEEPCQSVTSYWRDRSTPASGIVRTLTQVNSGNSKLQRTKTTKH